MSLRIYVYHFPYWNFFNNCVQSINFRKLIDRSILYLRDILDTKKKKKENTQNKTLLMFHLRIFIYFKIRIIELILLVSSQNYLRSLILYIYIFLSISKLQISNKKGCANEIEEGITNKERGWNRPEFPSSRLENSKFNRWRERREEKVAY